MKRCRHPASPNLAPKINFARVAKADTFDASLSRLPPPPLSFSLSLSLSLSPFLSIREQIPVTRLEFLHALHADAAASGYTRPRISPSTNEEARCVGGEGGRAFATGCTNAVSAGSRVHCIIQF
jgi:hypothetical protein